MTKITQNRINQLKSSIHSLRVFLNYTNSMKKKESQNKNKENQSSNNKNKNVDADDLAKISHLKKNQNVKKKTALDNKIKVLPGDCVVEQGQNGNTAFLIISGSFNVEIDKKVVGAMSVGEIFGELSLILGEDRKATVRAVTGSELVEINTSFLDGFLLTSKTTDEKLDPLVLETQKIIKELCIELGKKHNQRVPIAIEKLQEIVKGQSNLIQALSVQLHKRLTRMIKDRERNINNLNGNNLSTVS